MEDSVAPRAKEKAKAPEISSLKRMFEESASLTRDARAEAQRHRDYFDGAQWTREEKAKLAERKQPDNVFNRIRPAIEGIIGVIEQGQTDPRAWGRNPDDDDAADVATKVLRYIEDDSDFDQTKTECALDFFIEGTCAAIVEMDEEEVEVRRIHFEEFFYDPRSRRKDFSDARFLGIAKWRYGDEVAAEFPNAKTQIDAEMESGGGMFGDDTFEDRPTDASQRVSWVDKAKQRVMVVELYHKEGREWRRCVFFSGGVLDYGPSAYQNDDGESRCPIIAASCYIDRENNRYGKVKDMIGPQDEINKRRSKLLFMVSASQIQAVDPAAVEVDANTARGEAARPDGVIPFGWQKVQNVDMARGQAELLAEAKAEIERMGPNPAILGRQGESSSGRAALVRQQAGLTELAPVLGVSDRWVLRIYRAMWMCARQFWKAPRFIRITDDEGAPQFIGLNQPKAHQIQNPITGEVMQIPAVDPMTGQQMLDNNVGEIEVDITIESTPDTANVAQEQFLGVMELIKTGALQLPPQLIIKMSTLPNKRELLDELEKLGSQPNPGQQIEMADRAAQVDKTKAETALTGAKAANEMMQMAASYGPMLMPAAGAYPGAPG